ncbi:GNAT family N-acetyltransferase [Cryobacterium roopkundense]|uniref:GNAT superfamily N-acetyltransferase n=1 Tax=Cryobacterium roopkundense TaxID=1001240 RepID=A0A7W9E3I0_9MICO|nr:GNAT family N-acetyltransferase [Cryobacterium roopkundense]MBB5641632.1 GNAT superfamily N-acetyltransferase [Cryobacterium roopkundense]
MAATAVRNAVETEGYDTTELNFSAEEVLPIWLNQAHEPMRLFAARVDGAVVARAVYETLLDPNVPFAWLTVQVLPEFRRRGLGTALADRLESLARDEHRHTQVTYAVSREGPGDRLPSPTGFGSVPLANPEVRFLLRRGYALEQVERGSRLALPVDVTDLARLLVDCAPVAGTDYSLQFWSGPTPSRWLRDMALLHTRMSTDAPTAGLEEPEDVYTIERLQTVENLAATGPRTILTAVVVHAPTGRLAGFTQLSVPTEVDRPVAQEDTLVLREHRGHRLGMLLKIANLQQLARLHPGHPSVITFNAEENRHMLDVNEAIGFGPIGYEGAWKRIEK